MVFNHYNYVKWLIIYVSDIKIFENTNPDVY